MLVSSCRDKCFDPKVSASVTNATGKDCVLLYYDQWFYFVPSLYSGTFWKMFFLQSLDVGWLTRTFHYKNASDLLHINSGRPSTFHHRLSASSSAYIT